MCCKRKGFVIFYWLVFKEWVWFIEVFLIGLKLFVVSGWWWKIVGLNVVRLVVVFLVVLFLLIVFVFGGLCCFLFGEFGRFGVFLVSFEYCLDF